GGESFPTHGVVLTWLHVPIWRMAWAQQGELFDLNEWQVIIERDRIARTNGWIVLTDPSRKDLPSAPFLEGVGNIGWYDKMRLLFTSDNLGMSDGMIRKTLSIQTSKQMAVTGLAIHRFRLKTGHFPPN